MDRGILLGLLAFMLATPIAALICWLWLDARDRAELRRQEAEQADAMQDALREARGRYLTDDERRPE